MKHKSHSNWVQRRYQAEKRVTESQSSNVHRGAVATSRSNHQVPMLRETVQTQYGPVVNGFALDDD